MDASLPSVVRTLAALERHLGARLAAISGQGHATGVTLAIARVIGDVWLSALVSWVTGRSTAAETAQHMETAVRMLLRD